VEMGFFSSLFQTSKLNSDPDQQALAQLFIDVAESRKHSNDILNFFRTKTYTPSEAGNRVVHALSMVKVFRADLYPKAKKIGEMVYQIVS
jgi:hypothetical protein